MHTLRLRGARTHNLAGVDLDFHPGELVGIAGVSGSGKSSLALDTLYSEGQRRFVESFSPYARQFLERLERPPIDELDPVAAGVAVDRHAPVKSSRSTVATMADIEPYFSALFTREAVPVCPEHGCAAVRTDPRGAAHKVAAAHDGANAIVTYRVPVKGPEAYLEAREALLSAGYRRLLVDGETRDLDDIKPSEVMSESGRDGLEVVIDRVKLRAGDEARLGAALEEAWRRGASSGVGAARVFIARRDGEKRHERVDIAPGLSCPVCARTFDPPRAGLFSYQSPTGACPECRGFGRTIGIDWGKVIPDETRSIKGGAIRAWSGNSSKHERALLLKYCEKHGIPTTKPWGELTAQQREAVLTGDGTWTGHRYPGVRAWFKWLEGRTYKMHVRVLLARYRSYDPCAACGGKRLSPASLLYRIDGLDLATWHGLELKEARARLDALSTTTGQGEMVRKELVTRLAYLERVGLGYLSLDRQGRTLSGGEAQRVSLTAALGTSLTGALFVLDEPTVGLHPSDVPPLTAAMRELAAAGNVVLVIEHEPIVLDACDRIVELGPGAGPAGGRVLYDGLAGSFQRERAARRKGSPRVAESAIVIDGARANNLRNVTVEVPLGVVVAITGPSGSGKSTLVEDILYRGLARARGFSDVEAPGPYKALRNTAQILEPVLVDQAPLGRTSRGNPATYTGAWDRFRALFGTLPDAVARGLGPGHFSFNVALGRCEACAGEGYETVEMQFLADVSLLCPSCRGRRFKEEVLEVKLEGRSVADVLAMTVDEALLVFAKQSKIVRSLAPVAKLGLGYLALGQPLSTLSGGEAQRIKLAKALGEASNAGRLVILDEPSAGLHAREVARLNQALDDLVRGGASVIVVDHDLDVIGAADWVIDLGPGAGADGGLIVAEGTPAQVAQKDTRTGRALAQWLADTGASTERVARPARPKRALPHAIEVVHAREHNLHEVSVTIPHGKIVVVTGPSGSGKSTLAFDVVFAEGQRRFLETLTPYARQFLPTLPRPDVDRVTGVPPSIALEQRTTRFGSSSTVAIVTEIAHYLRLLFAKVGDAHCPVCDTPIAPRSPDEIFASIHEMKGSALLLAPAVVARKGTYLDVFTAAARAGITRAFADGVDVWTDKPPKLKKTAEHSIDLVVFDGRLASLDRPTFDRALTFGKGAVKLSRPKGETLLSTSRSCPRCATSIPEIDPRWFSFNTKQGRCEDCEGTGVQGGTAALAEEEHPKPCKACGGSRLAPVPRAVRLAGERYHEVGARSVTDAAAFAKKLRFSGDRATIAEGPLRELIHRLDFVLEVGLAYLGLDRSAATLSGGEMQRLRLAAQLGSGLTGALYVLDEPTIGLHPRDTGRLLENLRKLADMGSTVLMVEHDADTIRAADHLIDLGPSGGRDGGRVVAQGTAAEVLANPASPTGRALANEAAITGIRTCRGDADRKIELLGARANNLRGDDLKIPVGRMTVIAGVSGSGKSTLIQRVLHPAVRQALGLVGVDPGPHEGLRLPPEIKRVVAVDQSPIGRTPRSVPATFLGVWDHVRSLFAASPEAAVRGFGRARFSFNSAAAGGRCPVCDGNGVIAHEMSFLPDVTTPCEACGGARFEASTREIHYLGLSVGEVLDLSAEEAVKVFAAHPKIRAPLATMCDLGVGYLHLGQGSHTLSGGEAQRLKLASELTAGTRHEPTLYVLDEPTTGLHLTDVARLVRVLDRLVERGDTLVVIEHHPAVIASADYVVELGPEGGAQGGRIVATGTPAQLATRKTATGTVLRDLFKTAS